MRCAARCLFTINFWIVGIAHTAPALSETERKNKKQIGVSGKDIQTNELSGRNLLGTRSKIRETYNRVD